MKKNRHELIAVIILAIYILSGVGTPPNISKYINTTISHVILIVLMLGILTRVNIILGIVIVFAVYEVIRRASLNKTTSGKPNTAFEKFTEYPSPSYDKPVAPEPVQNSACEPVKMNHSVDRDDILKSLNSHTSDVLEIDIVSNKKLQEKTDLGEASYKPIQDPLHDATVL